MIASRAIHTLRLPDGRPWTLGERTLVMGILNVTPDSFADGGRLRSIDAAVAKGLAMVEAGADLLDLGGESTRPGAAPVAADEELRRVIPVVRRLAAATAVPLSIDTTKAEVARAALAEGATIVNDVSGLQYDAALGSVVAESGAPLVVMHMRGTPASMYAEAVYGDVVAEVAAELAKATARAAAEGIPRGQIVLDPGLGFAKRADQSFRLLAGLDHPALRELDRPWLVGPSRKSFLRAALGDVAPDHREWGTAAAVTAAVLAGAHVVRVHDPAAMSQVVRVADMIRASAPPGVA